MKKTISLILALIIVLSLSACRKKAKEPEPSPEPEATQEADKTTPKPEETDAVAPAESENPLSKPEATVSPTKTPAPVQSAVPSAKPSAKPTPAPTPAPTPEATPAPELSLSDIITSVQYGIELPNVAATALSSDLYSSYLFIDYIDGSEAMVSEPIIGSIPHSLVVLKLPEGTDAAATADAIRASANPRKWVCVEAEKVTVVSSGRYVMLVMSDTATADTMAANFSYLMSQQA